MGGGRIINKTKAAASSSSSPAAPPGRRPAGAPNKARTSNPASSSGDSQPRVIEDGVDMTPIPLGLHSWKLAKATSLGNTPEKKEKSPTLPTYEELGAQEVFYDSEGDDEGDDDDSPAVQYLIESKTETLLNITGVCVAVDFAGKAAIEEKNAAYEKMLEQHSSTDRYVDRHSQTINLPTKNAASLALPPRICETASQSTSWNIYDCNKALHLGGTDSEDNDEPAMTKRSSDSINTNKSQLHTALSETQKQVAVALASNDFLLDISEARVVAAGGCVPATVDKVNEATTPDELLFSQRAADILNSRSLSTSLARMERCVQQNLFHPRQLQYRNHPDATNEDVIPLFPVEKPKDDEKTTKTSSLEGVIHDSPPAGATEAVGLDLLWTWNAPMVTNRCVTGMCWNRVNRDALAVGYGGLSYAAPKSGLVLFWSLRNPLYPERVLHLSSGCTALAFSRNSPQLLAVGTHDGAVAVYDVRRDENGRVLSAALLDSDNTPGKHMDPVWQLKWVDKGIERGESLVSISTDGRVVEWSMKKGLEETTLMVLKRVGTAEGVVSRQASGLCFDFPIDDASVYLAGTEGGMLHRCSCSYNEQYLETYSGHTGPIYRVRCSPFWPPAFLSCSADWTVKLWHQKNPEPLNSFQSVDLTNVVHDVAWSPSNATVFASVAADGRIEIWDLKQSTLDPIARRFILQNDANRTRPAAATNGHDAVAPVPLEGDDGDDDEAATKSTVAATSVLFADTAPVLVVGDSAGSVTCYRIRGITENAKSSKDEEARRLRAAVMTPTTTTMTSQP